MIVIRHGYISARGKFKQAGSMRGARAIAIGTALGHVKYIQHRPGQDRDKGGRELFTDEKDNADSMELRQAIKTQRGNGVVIHKLMLSPEVNPADTKGFTREVMKQIGDEKGLDLEWYATAHKNTAHHHIHVVVLPKDKNGREVRFSKHDYERIREYGDRYLEKHHPLEVKRAQKEREEREARRLEERKLEAQRERQERIDRGEELPWLHKKIVRERLEPYRDWKREQLEQEVAREIDRQGIAESVHQAPEKPIVQDTISAAGRDWSREDKIADLRRLNEYLWDNANERIPRDEYKKLVGWMKEKEHARSESREDSGKVKTPNEPDVEQKREAEEIEYRGASYTKSDSYEKLNGLKKQLSEGGERLPVEDYQKLRGWIEDRDRERFSGIMEKELQQSKQREMAPREQSTPERYVPDLQLQIMRNPVMGLFMTEASIAAELVRSIPLDDRNRDYAKEARDELEGAKKDIAARRSGRKNPDDKAKDDQATDAIDKAIDEQKKHLEECREKQAERQEEREREQLDRDMDFWDFNF